MAGIIGIYGLVVSVLISSNLKQELPLYTGFIQLGAGLSVGLSGLAAGYDFSTLSSRRSSVSRNLARAIRRAKMDEWPWFRLTGIMQVRHWDCR